MRLLSLAPSNTEILYALGLDYDIIGVTTYCDYPSYFFPDVLKNWDGPGEVIHVEPKTLEDIYNSIKILGKVTKRVKKAEKIIQEMQREFERIRQNQPEAIRRGSPLE